MKIVAVIADNPGNYHRLQLPLSKIEGVTYTNILTERDVCDCDILYIHWACPKNNIPELSIWREKHNFKIVLDVDDVWVEGEKSSFISMNTAVLADHVICSTQYIADRVKKANTSVSIIPNKIPFGEGQFIPRKTTTDERIKVGISGSITHFENWMSLKSFLKRIKQDKAISDTVEFVIVGYENNSKWNKVISMFPKEPEIRQAAGYNKYMDLIDDIDIMLCPLLDTPINRGRSCIKLLECACKGIIPFIDELYKEKSDYSDSIHTITRQNWMFYLKKFIRERRLLDLYQHDNISRSWENYQDECVNSRIKLFSDLFEEPEHESYDFITAITYDNQDTEYYSVNNHRKTVEEKSYLFEYNVIIEQIDKLRKAGWLNELTNRYIGFFSWKFPWKTGFFKKIVYQILAKEDADIVVFCKPIKNYFKESENSHPGLMNILSKLCEKLNLKLPKEPRICVYSNFFAAKADVYWDYVLLLKQSIDILEKDLHDLCWQDSGYQGLAKEELKKYTGLDYYPFHTFVLERLMSIWIENNPSLKVKTYY